ncbi:DUF6141 family protein [Oceanobacillus sp. ISL-74]|uniref:DUF6141 family protein n=1 Tax=Oceanobacillus sp. ISL-74 TaxID=2819162 RepID=UPI001BEC23FF|nr:DUF6141 family protein [Oceanobacillus sp. ISL-74]MBT2599787.1 hypothetical protein [Oceanobacillus sp. ISL-74]
MKAKDNTVYREVQRPRQLWAWAPILVCTGIMWYWFIVQIIYGVPFGNNPASDGFTIVFWVIFGVIFPVVMLGFLKLTTEVHNDGIYIRLSPFHFRYRQFLFKDIYEYKSITYSPIKQFGGFGIRINMKGETVYNMNGKKGIELKLKYETVVIGTQNPDEFKDALDVVCNKKQRESTTEGGI